jgi:hypothetical protein
MSQTKTIIYNIDLELDQYYENPGYIILNDNKESKMEIFLNYNKESKMEIFLIKLKDQFDQLNKMKLSVGEQKRKTQLYKNYRLLRNSIVS